MPLFNVFLNLSILLIVVKSGISIPKDLTIFSISLSFNILYCIILIIVSAIKQIRKCAFICSSVHTYIGLPSKSLFIILKESSILDNP